jgi:DNA-directed RNA polymerase subunit beta'
MPGIMTDINNNPIELPILKSFGEGLDTASYWNTLYGVRKGVVDRSVNTQESGALNKALLNVNRRLLITIDDCGTDKGLDFPIEDKNLLGRAALVSIAGVVKRNQIIDGSVILKAKAKNIVSMQVRSPLTCIAVDGICQMCYGLMPNGTLPAIGTNVGILDSQAITERATQLTMQTFHTGGSALGGGGITQGFPRLEQLVKVPEKLSGKAALSTIDGTVQEIKKNAIGGYTITVDTKKHNVAPGLLPKVTLGQKVMKGDLLSEGVIKPQELGELKTHLDAQKYLVTEGTKIYGPSWHKAFETVVRGISDNAVITDAPEDSGFYKGDSSTVSYLDHENRRRKKEGIDPIKFNSYFKSIDTINTDNEDWFTRITTNRVKDALRQGAAKGAWTNFRGKDPIPAYLYSDEFGKHMNPDKGEFY